ncbi:hypothetical protein [Luteimonas saliphila]|uniref:hypothetical protein n=1 Tax=Luteimonas saliphila TaxID=2804919 RepID=UPI00192DB865|nr:hypothetical protein [Luteimonas saliphila]
MPSHAQIETFRVEDAEPALRSVAPFDYLVHYRLMEATGMVDALGGAARALAALKALGEQYERRMRSAEIPRLVPAAFDGTGLDSGFVGQGMGSFAGFLTGGMLTGVVQEMSDEKLAEIAKEGPLKIGDESNGIQLTFDENGSTDQEITFDSKVAEGLSGRMKIRIHVDACPDAEGKLTVKLDVDSQMSVDGKPGVGGHVRSEFTLERFLDDDAQLMKDNGAAAAMTLSASGSTSGKQQSFDLRMGYGRERNSGYEDFSKERGFDIFHMDEVRHAAGLAEQSFVFQQLVAELMLRGSSHGSPWESGRCVELKITSSPGKRKGIRPNTAFDLEAMPRAKSDGAPAGGSVTATLSGGASLQPAGGKVAADAKYAYAGPDKADEDASIAFEARSKRGVGRATLEFDTRRKRAYTASGGLDAFFGTGTICDLGATFTISGGGNTVTFIPSSEEGGKYTYQGNMGGIGVYGHGTYTASADDQGGRIVGTGNGCVKTPMGTHCANGTEHYTLVPTTPCE